MKLLSFGEVLWDLFGDAAHIGGAPLNLAAHFVRQGGEAALLSAVGRDALGKRTREAVGALSVDTSLLTVEPSLPTGSCTVTVDAAGAPHYALADPAAYDRIGAPPLALCADAIAFGTLALRHPHNREILGRILAEGHFGEIYTDLNVRPPFSGADAIRFCLGAATVAKMSDEELPAVTEAALGHPAACEEAARALASRYPQLRILLITEGERGALAYLPGEDALLRTPAYPASVASTVGAGDSFGAAFLYAYLSGRGIPDCLRIAARVSALVVSAVEAVPEYRIEDLI